MKGKVFLEPILVLENNWKMLSNTIFFE